MCFQKNNEINDSFVPPTEIRNAMSDDISNNKSKHRQDVRDLRYTKNHSLLNLRFSRLERNTRSWRPWPQERPLLIQNGNLVPGFSLLPVEGRVVEEPGNEVVQDGCRFATHALLPIILEESWVLEWIWSRVG